MKKHSMEKISAMSLRKSLGEFLNRVKYQDEIFIVERSGEPFAAIISIHSLDQFQEGMGQKTNISQKKLIPLEGSIEVLEDLEDGSREIAAQFKNSLKNTAQKL